MTSVMWFRRDLRVNDNKALYHACKENDLLLLFQVNPAQFITGSPSHQAFLQVWLILSKKSIKLRIYKSCLVNR